MDSSIILSFIATTVLLALMPGPDVLLVLTESISGGWRRGLTLAAGLCAGVLVHTAAAATGLSLLIKQSDILFSAIRYMGAAYFIYLAAMVLRGSDGIPTNETTPDMGNLLDLSKKGFLMNILNPKVSLFFIAFLPQFISPSGWSPTLQMLVLGGIFMAVAFWVFALAALLAGRLGTLLRHPRLWCYTRYSKAVVLGGLGLALLF